MARAQVGNIHGLTAVGFGSYLAGITADGTNTVTVDDMSGIVVGSLIDIINKNTGAQLAFGRQVTNLTSAGVLTYNGADVVAVPGTHYVSVALPLAAAAAPYVNLNGGPAAGEGFIMGSEGLTIDRMRAKLTAINATTYSAAELDKMTANDMVYAIRVNETASSIK